MSPQDPHKLQTLAALVDTIHVRSNASPDSSYTAKLLSHGVEKCAKKFGEEAFEIALASMSADKAHIRLEAADVLYHLLVLLEATGVSLSDVVAELENRVGVGGLAEKENRKQI